MSPPPVVKLDNQCLAWGIVGHELAHDTLGHANARVIASMGVGVMATAAGIVPGGGAIVGTAGSLGLAAYSKTQETEADARAVEYLERAGKPRWALRWTLEVLRETYGDTGGGWSQSHPLTSDRIAAQPEVDWGEADQLCGRKAAVISEARALLTRWNADAAKREAEAAAELRRQCEEEKARGVPGVSGDGRTQC